ncbi:MAG: hypothetical protein ACTHKC_00750 [Candidatus Nitrosocosmicus sp.]
MFFGSLSGAICNNSIPSGSCSPGVESLLSSNFGNSKSQTVNNSVCQTASCAIQGGTNGERICDPGSYTDTNSQSQILCHIVKQLYVPLKWDIKSIKIIKYV